MRAGVAAGYPTLIRRACWIVADCDGTKFCAVPVRSLTRIVLPEAPLRAMPVTEVDCQVPKPKGSTLFKSAGNDRSMGAVQLAVPILPLLRTWKGRRYVPISGCRAARCEFRKLPLNSKSTKGCG